MPMRSIRKWDEHWAHQVKSEADRTYGGLQNAEERLGRGAVLETSTKAFVVQGNDTTPGR